MPPSASTTVASAASRQRRRRRRQPLDECAPVVKNEGADRRPSPTDARKEKTEGDKKDSSRAAGEMESGRRVVKSASQTGSSAAKRRTRSKSSASSSLSDVSTEESNRTLDNAKVAVADEIESMSIAKPKTGRRRRVGKGSNDGTVGKRVDKDMFVDDRRGDDAASASKLSERASATRGASAEAVLAALKGAELILSDDLFPSSSRLRLAVASASASFHTRCYSATAAIASSADMESSLLLDERLPEVLNSARKLTRASSGKNPAVSNQTDEEKLSRLRISVHSLRAIVPVLCDNGGKRRRKEAEAVVKLLYYIIVTAEDLCTAQAGEVRGPKAKDGDRSKAENGAIVAASLCLAAFETLGAILMGVFSLRDRMCDGGRKGCREDGCDLLSTYPVPTSGGALAEDEVDALTWVQISKIGAQCVLSASSVLSIACVDGMKRMLTDAGGRCLGFIKDLAMEREFGRRIADWLDVDGEEQVDAVLERFRLIARSIAVPWILSLLSDTDSREDASEMTRDVLSQAKRLHRKLWDAAASIDKVCVTTNSVASVGKARRAVLSLRGDAILVLLLWSYDPWEERWVSFLEKGASFAGSRNILAGQVARQWDFSSSCAWKAAAMFSQSCGMTSSFSEYIRNGNRLLDDDDDWEALQCFHDSVGCALDRLYDWSGCMGSLSYIEYCAHRARHISSIASCIRQGRDDEVDGKENALPPSRKGCLTAKMPAHDEDIRRKFFGRDNRGENDQCTNQLCAFSCHPFPFRHDSHLCCTSSCSVSNEKGDACQAAASSALAVVFLNLTSWCRATTLGDPVICMRLVDTIITSFHREVLSSRRTLLPFDSLIRCHKLIGLLKLGSAAAETIKMFDVMAASSKGDESSELSVLDTFVLGRMLGECHAPLCSLLADKCNGAGASAYLGMATDAHVRAATVMDRVCEWAHITNCHCYDKDRAKQGKAWSGHDDENSLDHAISCAAQRSLWKCHEFACKLLQNEMSKSHEDEKNLVETVVKGLIQIAKRRNDQMKGMMAILPLSVSCDILASHISRGRHEFCLFSSKYSAYLASIMYTIGDYGCALAALATSIFDEIVANAIGDADVAISNDSDMDCMLDSSLLQCADFSNSSSQDETTGASSLPLKRLVHIFLKQAGSKERFDESFECTCFRSGSIGENTRLGALVSNSITGSNGDSGAQFVSISSILGILVAEFPDVVSFSSKMSFLREFILHLGREVARSSSKVDLQSETGTEDTLCYKRLFSEFHKILRFSLSQIEFGRLKEESLCQYRAALFAAAARALGSSQCPKVDLAREEDQAEAAPFACALDLAKQAEYHLDKIDLPATEGENSVLSIQRALVKLLVMQYSQDSADDGSRLNSFISILVECVKATKGLRTDNPILRLSQNVNRSLLFCVSKLQAAFDEEGAVISSAYAAALAFCLSLSSRDICDTWDLTYASFILIELGCYDLPICALNKTSWFGVVKHDETQVRGNWQTTKDIALEEMTALDALSQVRASFPVDIVDLIETVQQQAQSIPKKMPATVTYDDVHLWLEVQWVASTFQLALYEASEKLGRVETSLFHLRSCCHTCRNALALSKRYVMRVAFLPSRFLQRLGRCLQLTASVYARLGDYRKAQAYASSAIETLNIKLDFSLATIKRSPVKVLSLLEKLSGTHRQLECQTAFVDVISLSMDPDAVAEEALLLLNRTGLSSNGECEERCLSSVNAILCWGALIERGSTCYASEEASCYRTAKSRFDAFIKVGRSKISQEIEPLARSMSKSFRLVELVEKIPTFRQLQCDVVLKFACVKENASDEIKLSMYQELLSSPFATGFCRASAHFQVGLLALKSARENRDLYRLWHGNSVCLGGDDSFHNENLINRKNLNLAREHFGKACEYAGPSSQILSRHAMRCLALVMGPDPMIVADEPGYAAATLVHSSIGSTARQFTKAALSQTNKVECDKDCTSDIFAALDSPFIRKVRNENIRDMYLKASEILPAGWNFCAVALCPTGEILLSSIMFSNGENVHSAVRTRTVCIFPEGCDSPQPSTRVHREILIALDSIILKSQKQLSGMDSQAAQKMSSKIAKHEWWNERQKIDEELSNLVRSTEMTYFRSELVEQVFESGCSNERGTELSVRDDGSESDSETSGLGCGNLALKFEAACTIEKGQEEKRICDDDDIIDKAILNKKTVVKLKEELIDQYGIDGRSLQKVRKAELVELLYSEMQKQRCNDAEEDSISVISTDDDTDGHHSFSDSGKYDPCLFLVLDENFHTFPWENMDLMKGKAVSRIPSIAFAVAALAQFEDDEDFKKDGLCFLNPDKAGFVLDPEANLSTTKETMLSVLNSFAQENGFDWSGIVGEYPSHDFMLTQLTRKKGLFLYCGHGGGESCFGRSQIEDKLLSRDNLSQFSCEDFTISDSRKSSGRICRATVILMGCSSARLCSVNSKGFNNGRNVLVNKKSREMGHCTLFYEPEGIAMSYICAGAPCVVGNLWDVTDRDIDRFCIELLRKFLRVSPKGTNIRGSENLPRCLAEARSVCKMQSIVGFAPVCYGIPVRCKPRQFSRSSLHDMTAK